MLHPDELEKGPLEKGSLLENLEELNKLPVNTKFEDAPKYYQRLWMIIVIEFMNQSSKKM